MFLKKLSFFGLILILNLNCRKEDEFLFKMPYQLDIRLEPTMNNFDTHYFTFTNVDSNAETFFNQFNVDIATADKINPSFSRLSSFFSSNKLNFIEDMEVGFFENDPTDNADFRLLFYRDNIINNSPDIDLLPSLLNVHEDAKMEHFNVAVKIKFLTQPPEFIDCRLNFELEVVE